MKITINNLNGFINKTIVLPKLSQGELIIIKDIFPGESSETSEMVYPIINIIGGVFQNYLSHSKMYNNIGYRILTSPNKPGTIEIEYLEERALLTITEDVKEDGVVHGFSVKLTEGDFDWWALNLPFDYYILKMSNLCEYVDRYVSNMIVRGTDRKLDWSDFFEGEPIGSSRIYGCLDDLTFLVEGLVTVNLKNLSDAQKMRISLRLDLYNEYCNLTENELFGRYYFFNGDLEYANAFLEKLKKGIRCVPFD